MRGQLTTAVSRPLLCLKTACAPKPRQGGSLARETDQPSGRLLPGEQFHGLPEQGPPAEHPPPLAIAHREPVPVKRIGDGTPHVPPEKGQDDESDEARSEGLEVANSRRIQTGRQVLEAIAAPNRVGLNLLSAIGAGLHAKEDADRCTGRQLGPREGNRRPACSGPSLSGPNPGVIWVSKGVSTVAP